MQRRPAGAFLVLPGVRLSSSSGACFSRPAGRPRALSLIFASCCPIFLAFWLVLGNPRHFHLSVPRLLKNTGYLHAISRLSARPALYLSFLFRRSLPFLFCSEQSSSLHMLKYYRMCNSRNRKSFIKACFAQKRTGRQKQHLFPLPALDFGKNVRGKSNRRTATARTT